MLMRVSFLFPPQNYAESLCRSFCDLLKDITHEGQVQVLKVLSLNWISRCQNNTLVIIITLIRRLLLSCLKTFHLLLSQRILQFLKTVLESEVFTQMLGCLCKMWREGLHCKEIIVGVCHLFRVRISISLISLLLSQTVCLFCPLCVLKRKCKCIESARLVHDRPCGYIVFICGFFCCVN